MIFWKHNEANIGMQPRHLDFLKAFVEEKVSLNQWNLWFAENGAELQLELGRTDYLRLKFRPYKQACQILRENKIPFEANVCLEVAGHVCRLCGESLFHAIPGKTTQEEIQEFASRANIAGADEIYRDAWIHPGVYCPNGCTFIMFNFKQNFQEDHD